jgi:hypothetical protein
MSKRWYWWSGGGLLVALLALAAWRLSLQIPELLRKAEVELSAAAAQSGLEIRHGGLKLHILHLYLSLDNLAVRDAVADVPLARAGVVELSLSPLRLLKGELPVSRIRVRDFFVEAGERNRALYEKLTAGKEGTGGILPEILFVDGSVRLGPIGPVHRFEASVQELRIREGRFLGTRIAAYLSRARGEIDLPGGGRAAWPYPSLDVDLLYKGDTLKVRRARAWGGPSTVRLSGTVDMGKRTADWAASGDVDLARWIAAGAPMAGYARSAVRSGELDFSASASGPWNNPNGSLKISLRGGTSRGVSPVDGEAEVTVRDRVLRLDRIRGRIVGGSLSAAGTFSIDSGRLEGKASLSRISFAAVPWDALGSPFRLAGTADLEAEVSGTTGRLKGGLSLSLPGGFERVPRPEQGGLAVRVPISANVVAEVIDRETVRLETARLQVGRADIRGEGDGSLTGRTVRLRGSVNVPAGRAAEYGWSYPLAWESLAGEWEASGPVEHVRTRLSLVASGVAARGLPPLPITVKVDGTPAEALHFVADIPATAFKVTAVGTMTDLLDPEKARGDVSVAAREIDLAQSARWASAVASSLGEEPETVRAYFEGVSGIGEADGRVSLSHGALTVSGNIRFPDMAVRGIPLRSVKAEGGYEGADGRWSARGEGRFGDGLVHAEAKGAALQGAEVRAEIRKLEISQALSLLRRKGLEEVRGALDARVEARQGPQGWEFPHASAASKELSFGAVRLSDVRVEGNLGATAGKVAIEAASPRLALTGDVQRGGGWPANFSLTAAALPTSLLLAAAGRTDIPSGGQWSVEIGGMVRLENLVEGKPISPEAFPALRGSVAGVAPSVGEARFGEFRISGDRKGDSLIGELVTKAPDTRLSWEVSLREPFGFRLEGPFSFGAQNGSPKDEKAYLAFRGHTLVHGALRAIEKTEGTIRVDSLTYREAGFELSGKDLQAKMDPEGFRWMGGTVLAAGSPVRISGKVSWQGDLDMRLEGKLPARTVRLAVPGVFDRLDGTVTLDLRVTGNRKDPTLVGTGHLENGTLSFLDYAQQFEAMKADAVLSREKIVFEHFEGRSGGGYIDGWGEVPLKMDAGQRMYFSVDFMDMRYPYPEEIRPVIQGHAELFGPIDGLVVTGNVEVQSARYTRTMYPERGLLDFSRRLSDAMARREKSEFRVRLDIDVTADRTIRIKNNLADATASGDFKVQGDSGKVIILGSFDVAEGYVEFYGNRYDLRRVTVDFQDPRKNNPRLDARAETKKGGYNVTVLVSGTLEKPEVDFSSDPPLSQTDIVSLLSFGVTTQTLAAPGGRSTSGTGTVSGAAIAIGSIGGVDETIRGGLGLDKFSIETGFSQTTQAFEPRFVMRKSFEDRVNLSVSTSIGTSAETTAEGEIRVLEHMYLQGGWQSTTTNTQGQVSGDLKWKYRFQSLKDIFNGRD